MVLDPQSISSLSSATRLNVDNSVASVNTTGGLTIDNGSASLSASSAVQGLGTAAVSNGSGLLGQYYDNADLTNLKLTRTDPTINFNWSNGESPGSEIAPTTFSVRWTGAVEAKYSETYTFYTISDDGVRLWVNGQQLVNNWTNHGFTENSGTLNLVAGQKYDIKIEYYQATGPAIAQLWWSSSSQTQDIISQAQLYKPDQTLPTANLPPQISDVVTGSSTYSFTVVYSDLTGVNRATIDSQDLLVTGPNNFSQLATLVSVSNPSNATSLTASYQINAPGGVWNSSTVGLYTISLQANQVRDIDGNAIPASTLGTFRGNITPPTVTLNPLSLATQGSSIYIFRVDYQGTTPVNQATIDSQDVLVTGPNNFSQLAQVIGIGTSSDGSYTGVDYRITAPGGTWDATDAGTYTIALQANQVSDTSNNLIPATTLGTLQVDFSLPTAALVALTPVISGSAKYSFSVTYRDDVAVKGDTINDQDVLVTGPNNFSQLAKLVSVSPAGNGSLLTAVYSIDAPGGSWDAADEGLYTLTLQANQISDTSNNFSPTTTLGSLQVDVTPPTAKLAPLPSVTSGSTSYQFSVVYSDGVAVKRAAIDNQDVLVTGPNNFSQLATLVSVSSNQDSSPLTATYSITAPGGTWDAIDTGTYTIALQANQVSDLIGNFSPATTLGTLQVDFSLPTATLVALTPVISGSAKYSFSVTYRDDVAVKGDTINDQDVLVTGPNNFSQLAKLVSVSPAGNGSLLTAVYSIDAPGGSWDAADEGLYTLTLQANQISDTSNNFSPTTTLGSLQVDVTPPTAKLAPLPSVTSGSTSYQFSVVYSDGVAVKRAAIDNQDVLVTGPNNFSQLATLVSVSSNQDSSPLTATYSITAPGGTWDAIDTGTYTIALQANQVSDLIGNLIPATVLGSLPVDLTAPTAKLTPLTTANFARQGQNNANIQVVYSDGTAVKRSTLNNQDILVTGPNNFSQLAILVSVNSDQDSSSLTAIYSITAPGGVWDSADTGTYTIALQANQVSDREGNFIPASVLGTVIVDLTPPTVKLTTPTVLGGQTSSSFTVVYNDSTAVKRSTLNNQDILVTGPTNFSQLATLVSVNTEQDSSSLTATYSITAPGGVWDFTNVGTYTIALQANQVSDSNGNFSASGSLGTFSVDRITYTGDFNGDGKADILWRDAANQKVAIWLTDGTTLKSPVFLPNVPANYTIVDIADFNGDGKADILWRDAANQKVAIWLMDGTTLTAGVALPDVPANYTIVDTADFNGDGKADILWRDAANQKVAVWLMDGTTLTAGVALPDVPANYTIVDTADFNGDGKADILWRDAANQKVAVWLMDGTTLTAGVALPNVPANYTIVDTADFNGDGKADILWRDAANQKVAVWLMDGTTLTAGVALPDVPANYTIVDTADFNGDGKADILWRDAANQKVAIWLMDGTTLKTGALLPDLASTLGIVDTADFNGDGKTDILVQDASKGMIAIWFINGTQVTSTQDFSTIFV